MQTRKTFPLVLTAFALFGAALLHVVALLAGPAMIAALGAPDNIVQSARQGTMLAPLSILAIGAALAVLGLYAMSAAGRFRRLPCMRLVLGAAAGVFFLRALSLPAIWLLAPALRERVNLFEIATALLCFLIGAALSSALRKPGPVMLPSRS